VHTFAADDEDHPQISEVKAELKRLSREMNDVGYVPNTKFVLWDVEEEEKLSYLWHHSEKVTRNLQVFGDCHTATKFIAKLVGRAIIVEDANHFHHFEDSVCSHGDS
jgi:hypothetical protein